MTVCRRCGHGNDPGAEFCGSCSAYLAWDTPPEPARARGSELPRARAGSQRCLECGADNETGARFCRRCGATLDLVVLAGPSSLPPPAPPLPPPPPPLPSPLPSPPAERGEAVAPTVVPAAPAPQRPEPEAPPLPPGGTPCPQCGVGNEPGRRFCRRCGRAFAAAAPAPAPVTTPAPAARPPWWRRLRGDGGAAPAARAAYRRALDVRFRILRAVAVVAALGMGAGLAGVSGIDPVGRARDLWRRVFPREEPVVGVTAAADPAPAEQREFAAAAAVDGAPDTAWGTTWAREPGAEPLPGCAPDRGTGGADAALVLTLPAPTELSGLEVRAGLPQGDADRANQWRPTRLELRYDDGSCEEVALSADTGPQRHDLDAPRTGSVRISVLDAAAPPSGAGTLTTLAEVRLLRPA